MQITTTIKNWAPVAVVMGMILLASHSGTSYSGINGFYSVGWFLFGVISGAWLFRAWYKGGTERLNHRAIMRQNKALARARNYLSSQQPENARLVLAPFVRQSEIVEIQLLYAQALMAEGKTRACRELLVEQSDRLQEISLDRYRLWEPVYALAGETDTYIDNLAERFRSGSDAYLAKRICDYYLSGNNYDLLLEWASPILRGQQMDESTTHLLRQSVLRAVYEIVNANIRLDILEDARNLLEEYRDLFNTETIWYRLYAKILGKRRDVDAAIEMALSGYRLTANPILLLDAFSALVLSTDPRNALVTFVEWRDRFPEDGTFAYFVGWVLLHTGLPEEALSHFQAAIHIDGQHRFFANLAMSRLQHQNHNLQKALTYLESGTQWIEEAPFLWECKACGLAGHEPHSTCPRCHRWNAFVVLELPSPTKDVV